MGDIEVPLGYSVPGLGTTPISCSYPYMGFSISEAYDDFGLNALKLNDNSAFPSGAYVPTWKSTGSVTVKDNGLWNRAEKMFVKENGAWRKTNPKVLHRSYYDKMRFNLCGGGDSDHGGYSYKNWIMPNRYIVPEGWKIHGIRFAARYDFICDGVFLAQSQGLANALGNAGGKRNALVLCSRRNCQYIGGTEVPGTVEPPYGVEPRAFQWTIPSWARHQYPFTNGGNMMAVNLYSRWEIPYIGAQMCGGVDGGATHSLRLTIPETYTLPFPIDMIVSIRYSESCGGKNRYCNHYLCDGYLEFSSPYTRTDTYY